MYIHIYVYMSGGHSFAVRGQVGIVSRGVVLVAACGSSWAQAPGWEQVQWGAALTLGEGRRGVVARASGRSRGAGISVAPSNVHMSIIAQPSSNKRHGPGGGGAHGPPSAAQ